MRALSTLISIALLSGCSQQITAQTEQLPLKHFSDYQLYTHQSQPITSQSLAHQLLDYDVVLIGEWHGHSAVHRFQVDLLADLYQLYPNTALSMEQFTRDKQLLVNEYLDGKIGEQTLIKKAKAWPNYGSDYRPLVEFAKIHKLDVIAANAPKPIVQCVGRQGIGYLDKLTPKERNWVAENVDTGDSAYKEKFMASMHHGSPAQTQNQYAAQISWDETMAESITDYLAKHPGHKVVHTAGKFHTEQGLGTAASILKRNPKLKIAIVTPVTELSNNYQDYQLLVTPMPTRYVSKQARMDAYKEMGNRNKDLVCID
ncbi:ChaN family lipoprotein [Vibrio sp. SCSIO 43136]|uniref:ChaN family lipoprotein n=1 Tax=Vibrio sp. SCSIO 43136 TaxID=2819101 RepID=UPI002074AC20|nr:ChaN family lipoprotein [Vibrio sp. SCSIO 43136]USD66046.1 ChaN family lipoprotein [Vibrio sp. SCSIO 43136]